MPMAPPDARPSPQPSTTWHALQAAQALAALQVEATTGLTQAEAQRRLAQHGPNALPEPPPRPAWRTFVRQFKSPLIYILFVAAVLAVALGHHGDAGGDPGRGAGQRADRQLPGGPRRALDGRAAPAVGAAACGCCATARELVLEARELVPGDILLLAAGDAVAADARLLEAGPAAGGRGRADRRVGAGGQGAGRAARGHRPGRPPQHGVFRHPCHRRPRHAPWWWPPARTPRSAASPA